MVEHPSTRRRFVAHWVLSSYASAAMALVKGFLLLPLYFRYFDVPTYGAWLASANVVGMLGMLELGLAPVLAQRLSVAWGAQDKDAFVRLTGAGLVLTAIATSLFLAFGGIASLILTRVINAPAASADALTKTFILTVIGSTSAIARQAALSLVSAWQRSSLWTIIAPVAQLLEIVLALVLLRAKFGILALGISSCISNCLAFAISASLIASAWSKLQLGRITYCRSANRELFNAVLPILGSRILSQVAGNCEVLIISNLVSPASAAIYGLNERLYKTGQFFINPIAGSAGAALSHLIGERGNRRAMEISFELLTMWRFAGVSILATLLVVNRDFISFWIGSDKYGGSALNAILCLSVVFGTRLNTLLSILTSTGSTRALGLLSSVESVTRPILAVLGCYFGGRVGLAAAMAVLALAASFLYPGQIQRSLECTKTERRRMQSRGIPASLLCVSLAVLASNLLPPSESWLGLACKGLAAGLAFASILFTFDQPTQHMVRTFLNKLLANWLRWYSR